MSNIRKTLNRNIPTKKLLIGIGITLVILGIVITFAVKWGIDSSMNMSEYRAAQERCDTDRITVGMMSLGGGDNKIYYPAEQNVGPRLSAHYFCSDKEAEAAGYRRSRN